MKASKKYDHYYTYDEITAILKEYESAYPQYFKLSSLSVSKEGRNVWLAEITDMKTGDSAAKPGYLVTGHVHAGEVTGTMCAMYFIDYLLSNPDDETVQELLAATAFYVIPRPVPDGAEHWLTTPESLRSVNEYYPYVEDQEGINPKDLDGDGVIRTMLVKSPFGAFKKAKDDPRILERRAPDETKGEFYNVYQEGEILDFDGVNIFPAPAKFGLDLNRNFPVGWMTSNVQRGSGFYALDRQESRTLAEFILARRNINVCITFHTHMGLYLYPPGLKAKKEADAADMKRYERIAEIAREETGYIPMNIKEDYLGTSESMKTYGSWDDFLHFGNGIASFSVETWNPEQRSGFPLNFPNPFDDPEEKTRENAGKFFAWLDKEKLGRFCKPWTKFEHPQLGEVEIGGPDGKYLIQNAPPEFLPDEVEKHTRFILRHAKTLPHVLISDVSVKETASGIFTIDALIANSGYLPTNVLNEYKSLGYAKDVEVSLTGDNLEFLSGKTIEKIGQLEGFSGIKYMHNYYTASTEKHDPVVKKVSWTIKAAKGDTLMLSVSSERAGNIAIQVTL